MAQGENAPPNVLAAATHEVVDEVKPADDQLSPGALSIFDERFQLFTDEFGVLCERERVQLAVMVVADPKSQQPVVFLRGEPYDVARLLKLVYQQVRQAAVAELDLPPIR